MKTANKTVQNTNQLDENKEEEKIFFGEKMKVLFKNPETF